MIPKSSHLTEPATLKNTSALISAEEQAYNEIKRQILDARLMPGTRLVHRSLAKELGVSPVPVVLALRMLERDGLIVNRPGLGACVRTWTHDEIIDLFRIRAVQEALASRLCAERATPADMKRILAAAEAFDAAIVAQDTERNIQADVAFHMAVVWGAHCPDLERMIENLSVMRCSMKAFSLVLNVPRSISPDNKGIHDPIVSALQSRDAAVAELAGRRHVEESLARSLNWIEMVGDALQKSVRGQPLWWGLPPSSEEAEEPNPATVAFVEALGDAS